MGIEQFFGNLAKMDIFKYNNAISLKFNKQIKCDYLYFDFNSVVYTVVSQVENELNYLLYEIILYANDLSPDINKKGYDIAKKWNYNIKLNNKVILISDFYDFTLSININVIIEQIKMYLLHIIKNLIFCDNLVKLYISFDGVPNMGKIIEQKKRRYNGTIISGLKRHIYQKEFPNLSLERQLYEKYKYGYDRINIIADNPLMQQIYKSLQDFYPEIKKICPKLKYFVISGPNTKGEGEKKIMEDIILYRTKGDYSIFSPDADLIILSIILHSLLLDMNITSNFSIIRYEQMTGNYGLINVNLFLENITKYINDRLIQKYELNYSRIYFDIAYIYTLFGNDFIPRIEAIDPRKDLLVLVDKYIETIEFHLHTYIDPYIIQFNNKNYSINFSKFIYFINKISLSEINMLRDKYIIKHFNYNKIKKLFGSNLFVKLKEYYKLSNIIFDFVIKNKKKNIDHSELINLLQNSLTITPTIDIFIDNFLKLEKNFIDYKNNNQNLENKIVYILDTLSKRDKLPSFKLNRINEPDPESIKIDMVNEKMVITDYDRELHMLERKLGKYRKMLNGDDIDLGRINIVIRNNRYHLFVDDINKENNRYYTEMFGSISKSSIIENYLTGIFWIFDFYINKNNMYSNMNNISTWFYPYHSSPLLYDIDLYLRKNNFILDRLNNIMNKTIRASVKYYNFMNTFEHKLYVTPINKNKYIPEEYEKFVKNSEFFPDINQIVDLIWNNKGQKYIDCRNVLYLNKCNLLTIPNIPFNKYMRDLYKLRQSKKEKLIYPFIKKK